MNSSIALLVYDELRLFEFALAQDILRDRSAALGNSWYKTQTFALEEGTLRTENGFEINAGAGEEILAKAGTIVIPGWRDDVVPPAVWEPIAHAHKRGARIAAICTGTFVLAAAGLLSGRRATTHWRDCQRLSAQYPDIEVDPGVLYVDHGDVITSAGSAAGIDMLLHMARKDFGLAVCNAVARMMVVPPHRDGGQAQYVPSPVLAVNNSAFARLVEKVRKNPAMPYKVEDMAAEAAMSIRSFHRAFRAATGYAPYEWLLRERVRLARELLETTTTSVDRISLLCGFPTADAMRSIFRRVVGTTPLTYRRSFHGG